MKFNLRKFVHLTVLLFGVVTLSGCGTQTRGKEVDSTTTIFPAPSFVASPVVGQHLFVQNCSSCHSTGTNQIYGPGLEKLFLQKSLPSGLSVTIVNVEKWLYTGGGDMPSFSYLSAQERANIVAYLGTLHTS